MRPTLVLAVGLRVNVSQVRPPVVLGIAALVIDNTTGPLAGDMQHSKAMGEVRHSLDADQHPRTGCASRNGPMLPHAVCGVRPPEISGVSVICKQLAQPLGGQHLRAGLHKSKVAGAQVVRVLVDRFNPLGRPLAIRDKPGQSSRGVLAALDADLPGPEVVQAPSFRLPALSAPSRYRAPPEDPFKRVEFKQRADLI